MGVCAHSFSVHQTPIFRYVLCRTILLPFFKLTAIFHLKMFLKLCWRLGKNPAVLRKPLFFQGYGSTKTWFNLLHRGLAEGRTGAASAYGVASSLRAQWQFITMWQDVLFKVKAEQKHGISLGQRRKAPMEVPRGLYFAPYPQRL